jgi:hypothetical protein
LGLGVAVLGAVTVLTTILVLTTVLTTVFGVMVLVAAGGAVDPDFECVVVAGDGLDVAFLAGVFVTGARVGSVLTAFCTRLPPVLTEPGVRLPLVPTEPGVRLPLVPTELGVILEAVLADAGAPTRPAAVAEDAPVTWLADRGPVELFVEGVGAAL